MHKLPHEFLAAIALDANLNSGQFSKSQFVVECLGRMDSGESVSGVYFPSRRANGGVIILNPQTVSIEIVYTGQMPPSGLLFDSALDPVVDGALHLAGSSGKRWSGASAAAGTAETSWKDFPPSSTRSRNGASAA
jgi:hypothetical protein